MHARNGRWFHHHINGIQAEKLLLDKGVSGSFLARPSNSSQGSYTISVRRGDSITHIRVQNSNGFLDLYGGEKFATLSELVSYYMDKEGQLRERNGDLLELKYPFFAEDPTTERWFHGRIGRDEAEKMLLEKGKEGSYLVRESIRHPDSFVLSVVTGSTVAQIRIHQSDDKYDIGGGHQFVSLKALIDFYAATPMVEKEGGLVSLKQPLNATRFNVSAIEKRMKQLANSNGFTEEFEGLHRDLNDQVNTKVAGSLPANRDKNRFINILPFDVTRVKLADVDVEDPVSSYINANYIHWPMQLTRSLTVDDFGLSEVEKQAAMPPSVDFLFSGKPRYIATQGILAQTQVDFWRMVWQERSSVLVMITKEVERFHAKCERYWPTEAEATREFPHPAGILRVSLVNERCTENYALRELFLTRESSDQHSGFTVWQYHFTVWPDHGTPDDPSCVLDFAHDISMRQDQNAASGPIVVHCSAGIGRTGTLIVIDMLINFIKTFGLNCDIDIWRTVQAVREQRVDMVQTENQYQFIYRALHQYIHLVSKRVDLRNTSRDYSNINRAHEDIGLSVAPPTRNLAQPASPTTSRTRDSAGPGVPTSVHKRSGSGVQWS